MKAKTSISFNGNDVTDFTKALPLRNFYSRNEISIIWLQVFQTVFDEVVWAGTRVFPKPLTKHGF